MFKEKLQDYTEDEFLNFLGGLRSSMKDGKSLKGKELEMYWDSLVDHFIEITQHPSGSDQFSTLKVKEMISLKTS